MSNELTVYASATYSDASGFADALATATAGFASSPGTLKCVHIKQSITTSEVALNLGGISAPGYVLIINRDPTNYVQFKPATSGALTGRLLPNGGCMLLYLDSGAQAPFLQANTASCLVDVFICSQ